MQVLKAWISIDGIAVDDEAISSTVFLDLENGRVRLGFPTQAVEVDAIARGKQFLVERDIELFRILQVARAKKKDKLRDESGMTGYEIVKQNESNTRAVAWLESGVPPHVSATPIQIVDSISGNGQITIGQYGIIEVSSDLVGKTIRARLPVTTDKRVTVKLEPLETFTLHVIAENPERVYLSAEVNITITSPAQGGTRWLEGTFEPKSLQTTDL